jgi:hypothetical protein
MPISRYRTNAAPASAEIPNFQKSTAELASSLASQNLKFERADWALFRTVEGLQQKAGREGAAEGVLDQFGAGKRGTA